MKVTKVHRVLGFRQAKWLKPYVELNTMKRKAAKNKFDQDFFKLMVNSAFGKTCESKRNRFKVHLVRNEEEVSALVDKPEFRSFQILDNNLATVTVNQTEVLWDKPTVVGACILDLAKMFMFEFHHTIMKKHFECCLLYSDTDSFVYEVRSDDVYKDLEKIRDLKDRFDFSNFPAEHPLFDKSKEKETLLFKDEMQGQVIQEFIGLKPKMYSIKLVAGWVKAVLKGVSRDARRYITHELYRKMLEKGDFVRLLNTRICSSKHQLHTMITNKKSLSGYDDKRYILDDIISMLPYGHRLLREKLFANMMDDDEELGLPDKICETPDSKSTPFPKKVHFIDNWSPPDPGFHQRSYDEEELRDIADLDEEDDAEEEDSDRSRCCFIDSQASVAGEKEFSDDSIESCPDIETISNQSVENCVEVETLSEEAYEPPVIDLTSDSDKENTSPPPIKRKRTAYIKESGSE